MSTSTYDGVFLAPESIVSDLSVFSFLKTDRGARVEFVPASCAARRNRRRSGVAGGFGLLVGRILNALR